MPGLTSPSLIWNKTRHQQGSKIQDPGYLASRILYPVEERGKYGSGIERDLLLPSRKRN